MFVECPHCGVTIEVLQVNCNVFRCGVYKSDINKNINPHLPKIECEKLVQHDLIYGCGKPFTIKNNIAVICDYI